MKTSVKYFNILLFIFFGFQMQAQEVDVLVIDQDGLTLWERNFPNFRPPNRLGINNFEANKDTLLDAFDGVQVRIGGASTIQFQALDHETSGQWTTADGTPGRLGEIGSNFNLATANLDLDVFLAEGVRMHLRTYLSARHHPEAWVKGGYIQIDKLDFISEGFAEDLMEHVRFKVGHMENNYGDAHFRRTDNAMALYNPFVGNYIMDSFTTEVGAEVYYFGGPWLAMGGITNGKLNQSVTNPSSNGVSWLGKIGYDDQVSEDLRFRLTGSVYHTNQTGNVYLYGGDRAGSRYYLVLEEAGASPTAQFTSGRYNPGFGNEVTAFMVNPFVKFGGLEFFGTYERASGKRSTQTDERAFTQMAGELIYRFGQNENLYVGGRYNTVEGDDASGADIDINRFQIAGGWFMTKNILAKVEYVNQNYNGFNQDSKFHDAKFSGLLVEAAISF